MSSQVVVNTGRGKVKRKSGAPKKLASSSAARSMLLGRKRSSVNKDGVTALRLYSGVRQNRILPQKYSTVLESTLNGYIAAGSMSVANGNYFDVLVNSLAYPWNTTYYASRSATYSPSNISLVQGYAITNGFIGATTLLGLYTKYRVNKYKLDITVIPQNTGDSTILCAWPMGNSENFNAGATAPTCKICEGQPRAKTRLCVANSVQDENRVVIYGKAHEDLGISRLSYEADAITLTTNVTTTNYQDFVGVFLQIADGATNTGIMVINMKLTVQVDFMDLVEQIN